MILKKQSKLLAKHQIWNNYCPTRGCRRPPLKSRGGVLWPRLSDKTINCGLYFPARMVIEAREWPSATGLARRLSRARGARESRGGAEPTACPRGAHRPRSLRSMRIAKRGPLGMSIMINGVFQIK